MMFDHKRLKEDLQEVSDFLFVLGEPKRLAIILRLLEENSCDGLQVNDLTESTGLTRPAVSHHLKILRDAKLVDYREEGTKNFYYLSHDNEEIYKLRDFLNQVIEMIEGASE